MKRELILTQEPIDEPGLLRGRCTGPEIGAAISFLGLVRGIEGEKTIEAIEYEAFVQMVERQFGLLFDAIENRWPIQSIRLVHRIGYVPVAQPSLWVEVLASHRGEAFAACQYLIDEMKRIVPIWKKPVFGPPA